MYEDEKKKNVLDMQFQKYLIIASTSVIIVFIYLVGVGIAFLTKQVKLDDFIAMGVLLVISTGILGVCSALFFNAVFHLKNIPEVIKEI